MKALFAWRDVVSCDTALVGPCENGVAGEFAAVKILFDLIRGPISTFVISAVRGKSSEWRCKFAARESGLEALIGRALTIHSNPQSLILAAVEFKISACSQQYEKHCRHLTCASAIGQ